MASKRLTVTQRREIFQTLVATQDEGMKVSQSFEHVSKQYEISDSQIRQIQEEGIEKQWPPLDELAIALN